MQEERFRKILQTEYSLDDYDYIDLKTRSDTKECPLCKKLFYPEGRNRSRQRYCKRTHVINCIICGTPIEQKEASEKYGTVKFTCSKECANKAKIQNAKETMQAKYGAENPSEIAEFREKANASLRAKSKETAQKVKSTLTERYGGMGTASPILRKKIEKTMTERYGVKNPSYSSEIKQKISEIASSEEFQEKYKATAMANWGVDRPSRLPEVIAKMKKTNLERYGVECTYLTPESIQHLKENSLKKYGVENPLHSDYSREKARQAFIANAQQRKNNKISKINQKVAEVLSTVYGVKTEYEFNIGRASFDLVVSGKQTVLEIDPTYTHSTLPNHWRADGLDNNYHLKKTNIAMQAGYRCIHIFDWDDPDKIYLLLQNKEKIYARNCTLSEINNLTAQQFLDKYHIQSGSKGSKIQYGLFYKGKLVEVMTFGKPRYNKHYEWELLRLCSISGKSIIGGASRLFYHFIKDQHPQSILSYCDRAKFTGDVYQKIGMKLHHITEPTKVWSKGNRYITDNYLRQRGYDQLFGTNYGKGTSNEQLMIEHGWSPVYDCGQYVFEWFQK